MTYRHKSLVENAFDKLLGLHAEIEHDLDGQLASITAREAEAQRIVAQCFEERQRIDRERAGLKEAERIYRDAFGSSSNASQPDRAQSVPRAPAVRSVLLDDSAPSLLGDAQTLHQKQVRARIGPQRFLMFDAISTMTQLRLEDLSTLTKLPYRRIKDQMVSDVRSGMVMQSGDLYSLTSGGMDLLSRFKVYKRAHGQPLPTADDIHGDDDRDDAETDDQASQPLPQTTEAQVQSDLDDTPTSYAIADHDGRITDRMT